MGLLERVRDAIFGKRIIDPSFGELQYQRFRYVTGLGKPAGPGKYYEEWFGRMHFAPTDHEIGVVLPSDATGPHEKQRAMFREIESRWNSLTEPLSEALYTPFQIWFENYEPFEGITPREMYELLQLVGFCISHPILYPNSRQFADFDVEFKVPVNLGGHSLMAHVKDWKVVQAGVE